MKSLLTRRRACAAVLLSPLVAQVAVGFARARQNDLPTLDARTAELPAETLHAIGTRLLRDGRTFEKAAAHFLLASQKEPTNPKHQSALGCALASRAASLSRAALYTNSLAQQQADYPADLKKWEEGRADWEIYKTTSPQVYAHQEYEDRKPVAPPSYQFMTKDDKAPFRLTQSETAARLSDLSQKAQEAWKKGVDLSKTSDEKAQALYVQAWGLTVLRWSLAVFSDKGAIDETSPMNDANNGKNTKPLANTPTAASAMQAIEEAARLDEKNARYAQSVGDMAEEADKAKAFAAYEKAVVLAPKDRNLLYLMYQKTAAPAEKKGETALSETFQKAELQKPDDALLAVPLGYLHRAQARDRSNAWPLYEEASLLFRLAPYAMMGGSARRDATPEQKQAAIDSVLNETARKRGKRAIAQITRANALPICQLPVYTPSVSPLLAVAWKMTLRSSSFLMSDETFDSYARLRELVRAVGGYTHVLAENENKLSDALNATRAALAMGERILKNGDEDYGLGRMICLVAYKNCIKMYQKIGDTEGAEAIEKEMDDFQKWETAYQRNRKATMGNETLAEY